MWILVFLLFQLTQTDAYSNLAQKESILIKNDYDLEQWCSACGTGAHDPLRVWIVGKIVPK